MRPTNQFLSVPSAARLLGRSARAVHRAIERGSLPAQRIRGSHDRVPAAAVAALLESCHSPARLQSPQPADAESVCLAEPVGV